MSVGRIVAVLVVAVLVGVHGWHDAPRRVATIAVAVAVAHRGERRGRGRGRGSRVADVAACR